MVHAFWHLPWVGFLHEEPALNPHRLMAQNAYAMAPLTDEYDAGGSEGLVRPPKTDAFAMALVPLCLSHC